MNAEDRDLLTGKEIAQILKVGESTIRYWRDTYGDFIPTVGDGKRRRYRPEAVDVLRFVQERANRSEIAEAIKSALARAFPRNIQIAEESQRSSAATQQRESQKESQNPPAVPSLFDLAPLAPILERFTSALEKIAEGQAAALDMLTRQNAALFRRVEELEARGRALEAGSAAPNTPVKRESNVPAGHNFKPVRTSRLAAPSPQKPRKVKGATDFLPSAETGRPGPQEMAKKRAALGPLLLSLREQGMTDAEIAREMEARGVPTISGSGRWARGTVFNLIKKIAGEGRNG